MACSFCHKLSELRARPCKQVNCTNRHIFKARFICALRLLSIACQRNEDLLLARVDRRYSRRCSKPVIRNSENHDRRSIENGQLLLTDGVCTCPTHRSDDLDVGDIEDTWDARCELNDTAVPTPSPTVNTPEPVVPTPSPETETPGPTVGTPAPESETPPPVDETPSPTQHTPQPSASGDDDDEDGDADDDDDESVDEDDDDYMGDYADDSIVVDDDDDYMSEDEDDHMSYGGEYY